MKSFNFGPQDCGDPHTNTKTCNIVYTTGGGQGAEIQVSNGTYSISAPAGLNESSERRRKFKSMIRSIPAISGFGQKSNGQSSSLGGLVQYAATYLVISVRLRQLTVLCETVELNSTSRVALISKHVSEGGDDMSAEGKGEDCDDTSALCERDINQTAGRPLGVERIRPDDG